MRRYISFVVYIQTHGASERWTLDYALSQPFAEERERESNPRAGVLVEAKLQLDEESHFFFLSIINKWFFSHFTLRYANSIRRFDSQQNSRVRSLSLCSGGEGWDCSSVLVRPFSLFLSSNTLHSCEGGKCVENSEGKACTFQQKQTTNTAVLFCRDRILRQVLERCVWTLALSGFVEIYRFYGRKEKREQREKFSFSWRKIFTGVGCAGKVVPWRKISFHWLIN